MDSFTYGSSKDEKFKIPPFLFHCWSSAVQIDLESRGGWLGLKYPVPKHDWLGKQWTVISEEGVHYVHTGPSWPVSPS